MRMFSQLAWVINGRRQSADLDDLDLLLAYKRGQKVFGGDARQVGNYMPRIRVLLGGLAVEKRKLGGDIMIHGSNVTIGCVPIGDEAIEEVFYLVAKAGLKNVEIVISPYDMRKGRKRELEVSPISWYPRLCDDISAALGSVE